MVTFESFLSGKEKIAVVGLGYVGLPLAYHMSKYFSVVGYDLKEERIRELEAGYDRTMELTESELKRTSIQYTNRPEDLSACHLIIVAVPTPIDEFRNPDLTPLKSASETVGKYMSEQSCIVYESTVFPGATEEVCVPILKKCSGMVFGKDFYVGYSPERMNPGDRTHSLENIVKVISGSDDRVVELLSCVYGKVVKAGLFKAASIKVAEAAKVIENTQRDLNIALMNELAMIFDKLGIETMDVLEAAGTKWNFLPFRPGLVGGHCIGVDPYYLTFKAESIGYHPEMILAGRRINDGMGKFIAERTVKMLIRWDRHVRRSKIAVLGITFKENVPDLRNTKVVDVIRELKEYGVDVYVHDPYADSREAKKYYDIELTPLDRLPKMDGVIIAVAHRCYADMGFEKIVGLCSAHPPIIVDVKGVFKPPPSSRLNIEYWRL